MERTLTDRVENYDSEITGHCSCGIEVIKVINSSASGWKDKSRYRYPSDNGPANIFRCRGCMKVITESFIPYPVAPSEDKTAEDFLTLDNSSDVEGKIYHRDEVIKAMTEYGNLRWNKAIEEAIEVAEDRGVGQIVAELNKLKV